MAEVASQAASVPIANRLLAALSAKDFARLSHDLEPVELPFKMVMAPCPRSPTRALS